MTREEYVKSLLAKNYPTQVAASEALGLEENTVRRYFNNLRKPGDAVCRAVQLLDFVRSQGLVTCGVNTHTIFKPRQQSIFRSF